MLKKIALFGAAACFAFSAAATAGGFYVGAGVGYGTMKRPMNFTDVDMFSPAGVAGTFTNVSNNINNSQFGDGANGKLFLGYGFCLSNGWYVAPEIFGTLSSVKTSSSDDLTIVGGDASEVADNYSSKLDGTYGIGIRPGYYVYDNTMLFADFAYSRGKFEDTDTRTTTFGLGTVNGGGALSMSNSHWANGFQYGAGVEVNLTGQLGLRAEFLQTRYSSWSWTDGVTDVAAASSNPLTFTEKPTTNEANVNLVWTVGDLGSMGS